MTSCLPLLRRLCSRFRLFSALKYAPGSIVRWHHFINIFAPFVLCIWIPLHTQCILWYLHYFLAFHEPSSSVFYSWHSLLPLPCIPAFAVDPVRPEDLESSSLLLVLSKVKSRPLPHSIEDQLLTISSCTPTLTKTAPSSTNQTTTVVTVEVTDLKSHWKKDWHLSAPAVTDAFNDDHRSSHTAPSSTAHKQTQLRVTAQLKPCC